MDAIRLLCFQLQFAICYRQCVSHLDIKYFQRPIFSRIAVSSEQVFNGMWSMLSCACLCAIRAKCLGYRFSDGGNCYIGEQLSKGNDNSSSISASYILQGISRCGTPPFQANARVSYAGDFVSSVATYICTKDYRSCGNNITTVCELSGKWKPVQRGCKRYRWKNPRPDGLYINAEIVMFNKPIPYCEDAETIYVKLKFTPTKNTAFSFYVRREKDFPFFFTGRFHWHGQVRTAAANSYKNGLWGREVRIPAFPFAVRKTFSVEMTYGDGEYKVQMGKRCLVSFKDRYPGMQPRDFVVGGDANVELNIVFTETIPFWNEAKTIYIKVKGKPTKNRSFSLELRHQSDILFYMAARFRAAHTVKKIVFNTRKAENWDREIRKANFPFSVGKTCLLEIAYSDGEYKVQINHRDWPTFKEQYPRIRPTYLTIRDDFNVKLVEMYYKYKKPTA